MENKTNILSFIANEVWAIQPQALETIVSIVQRENDIEAVEAKAGKPLDYTHTVTMRGDKAIIPVIGPIFRYANLFTKISGATSIDVLARDFQAAIDNDFVKSIVLEIDSPGGQAAGISEFAEMVNKSSKPVTAYVSNLAASAAYWIASAADKIIISDTSMLGSIGTVIGYEFDKNDEKRFDRGKIISSQSPLKQVDPRTETGKTEYQRVVNELAGVFISAVARYRGVQVETVLSDFGKGGVLVGKSAVQASMADSLGSFEKIIKTRHVKPVIHIPKAQTAKVKIMNENEFEQDIKMGDYDAHAVEQKVKQRWETSAEMRDEFMHIDTAVAYFQAVSRGGVKVLKHQEGLHRGNV